MMTPRKRVQRAEDRLIVPMFVAGCVFILLAGGLAAFTAAPKDVIYLFGVVGALLLPTNRVLSAVRLWRNNGGDDARR